MAYVLHLLILVAIFALLAAALNVAAGYARLLSVSHAALFGIGAYTSALLVMRCGTPWPLALAAALGAGVAAGALLGTIAWRLRGDYFLMATLGAGEIVHSIMVNASSLTGGPVGLMNVPPPAFGRWVASGEGGVLLLYVPVIAAVVYALYLLERSPLGRVLRAIGDDELGAQVLGKPTPALKMTALCVSGAVAAVAGAMYAHYASYIDPSSFVFDVSLLVLVMVVLGGLGNVLGACVGTTAVLLLPEALRFVGLPAARAAQIQQVLFGTVLIAMMVFRFRGFVPPRPLEENDRP